MNFELIEKKRKQHRKRKSNITYTTGMPFLGICHFNKDCLNGEKEAQEIATDYNNMINGEGTIASGDTSVTDSTFSNDSGESSASGAMAESILHESSLTFESAQFEDNYYLEYR